MTLQTKGYDYSCLHMSHFGDDPLCHYGQYYYLYCNHNDKLTMHIDC